ncbi:hypothetical protein K438DRAFT_1954266 [Mycena galopus ATCC 62051]|nr:hypothetical protein K438DRAFT_1954266 [Mycena galopus ATCC 62051]
MWNHWLSSCLTFALPLPLTFSADTFIEDFVFFFPLVGWLNGWCGPGYSLRGRGCGCARGLGSAVFPFGTSFGPVFAGVFCGASGACCRVGGRKGVPPFRGTVFPHAPSRDRSVPRSIIKLLSQRKAQHLWEGGEHHGDPTWIRPRARVEENTTRTRLDARCISSVPALLLGDVAWPPMDVSAAIKRVLPITFTPVDHDASTTFPLAQTRLQLWLRDRRSLPAFFSSSSLAPQRSSLVPR